MKQIIIVAKKELLEIFRRKASLFILALPLFIFPVFQAGIEYINDKSSAECNIMIQSDDQAAFQVLRNFLKDTTTIKANILSGNNPVQLLNAGKIQLFIKISKAKFDFVFNSSFYNSISLAAKVGEEFERYYYNTLKQYGVPIYSFNLKDENDRQATASHSLLNIFIPILIVVLIFQGTSSFANDLFAGEKERKTFELLLLSGVKRSSIYFGKITVLIALSLLGLFISLGTCLVSFGWGEGRPSSFKFLYVGSPCLNIAVIVYTLFSLSVLSVILTTTVSLLSKSMRDAQIINEITLTIPVGAVVLLSLGYVDGSSMFINFLPIFNLIGCFYNAFAGVVIPSNTIITIIFTFVFGFLLVAFCLKYLHTEKVLK